MKIEEGQRPQINANIKKQTVIALVLGLGLGSLLIFTVVWSSTKARIQELEEKKKIELQDQAP